MRIITLNTWGGRGGKVGLLDFFSRHREDTDIFCLQEIWSAPYEHLQGKDAGGKPIDHSSIMVYGLQEISAALPEHVAYFHPHHLDNYGLLMMVHKRHVVHESGEIYVYRHKGYIPEGDSGNHARNIQFVVVGEGSHKRIVVNFHGLWNGKGKGDSDARLEQSEKIIRFLESKNLPTVFLGDFNLLPDTESLKKIEAYGLRNLIAEFGITSTRTSLYAKPERYADYVFVSSDIAVSDFKVLPDEVSDHAPLLIDIE